MYGRFWRCWHDKETSSEPSSFRNLLHDEVIKWKHFPRNWPFVRRIHRSPVNCPHKGQWRGALMLTLISAWTNSWVNRDAGDLRRHRAHHDVTVMRLSCSTGPGTHIGRVLLTGSVYKTVTDKRTTSFEIKSMSNTNIHDVAMLHIQLALTHWALVMHEICTNYV